MARTWGRPPGLRAGFKPAFGLCVGPSLGLFLLLAAPTPPRRIVSTAPSITEILYALDLSERVAAVTIYCHYPPEARKKPKIGTYLKPDLEAILQLRPDLVVLLAGFTSLNAKLPGFGIPVLEVKNDTIENIFDSIVQIGRRTGVEETARQRMAKIRKDLDDMAARLAGRPKRTVMFVVGRTPGTVQDLIVVGGASYLNELLERAGGRNAFQDTRVPYPKVSREEVLARHPDVIIDMGDMADTDIVTEEHKRSVVALWKQVSRARVYAVASDLFVVPGPRVGEAARELARMIHPEAGL